MGPHSREFSDVFNQQDIRSLDQHATIEAEQKLTSKSIQADWTGSHGKAGTYVELYAGGGIFGFNPSRDDGMCLLLFLLQLTFVTQTI
jgi:hypothetical protein